MSEQVIEEEVKHITREISDICEVDHGRPIIPCLVDFDGTIVMHEYPNIGKAVPHAIELMKEYTEKYNVGWILDTMRSGKLLDDAIKYIESNGIKLYGVGMNPTQHLWTSSTKAYGIYRWDDNSAGAPKLTIGNSRPFLDWLAIHLEMQPIFKRLVNNSIN